MNFETKPKSGNPANEVRFQLILAMRKKFLLMGLNGTTDDLDSSTTTGRRETKVPGSEGRPQKKWRSVVSAASTALTILPRQIKLYKWTGDSTHLCARLEKIERWI